MNQKGQQVLKMGLELFKEFYKLVENETKGRQR